MLVEWRAEWDARAAIGGNGQLFALEVGLGKEVDSRLVIELKMRILFKQLHRGSK